MKRNPAPPTESIRFVTLDQLVLDPENPRLPTGLEKSEQKVMEYIAASTAIEDLASAIAENDYFPGEPLVVVPGAKGKFTVVEGNRRLTALRLLQNPRLIRAASRRLIDIAESAKHRPKEVPVVVRRDRSEVLPYLGFRHITGVKEWPSLAKARYMKQLFDRLTRKSQPTTERYTEVARAIGSRSNHIRRNLDALAVYRLLEEEQFFDLDGLDENSIAFGTLYTAIGDDNVARFVGAAKGRGDSSIPTHPIVDPKALVRRNVRDLITWMYEKNKDGETILGDSRNIRQLGLAVSSPLALKALRSGARLDAAYRLTEGGDEDFSKLMYEADASLRQAAGLVATVSKNAIDRSIVENIIDTARLIADALLSKSRGGERR